MVKVVMFCCVALLGGCVSQSVILKNAAGQETRCANWGFGLIGAPVAMAAQSNCVKNARAAGYSDAPPAPPAQTVAK